MNNTIQQTIIRVIFITILLIISMHAFAEEDLNPNPKTNTFYMNSDKSFTVVTATEANLATQSYIIETTKLAKSIANCDFDTTKKSEEGAGEEKRFIYPFVADNCGYVDAHLGEIKQGGHVTIKYGFTKHTNQLVCIDGDCGPLDITTHDKSFPEDEEDGTFDTLTANGSGAEFSITGGADRGKFSLSGTNNTILTFSGGDYEEKTAYAVQITAKTTDGRTVSKILYAKMTDVHDLPGLRDTGFKRIYSNKHAFVALRTNGSLFVWGDWTKGGTAPPKAMTNVAAVFSNELAFAVLKTDGTVVAWGDTNNGGSIPNTRDTSNTKEIFANQRAFVALKHDGSIVAWGNAGYGGLLSTDIEAVKKGVKSIASTERAFAALYNDGTIDAWSGTADYGAGEPTGIFSKIFANQSAFVAITADGSLVAWGNGANGGNYAPKRRKYSTVFATEKAFAALGKDGSIDAWGLNAYGGNDAEAPSMGEFTTIVSNERAFAALEKDGSIKVWGDNDYGGNNAPVLADNEKGFVAIYSTNSAFVAVKADGTLATWGSDANGGDTPPMGKFHFPKQ